MGFLDKLLGRGKKAASDTPPETGRMPEPQPEAEPDTEHDDHDHEHGHEHEH